MKFLTGTSSSVAIIIGRILRKIYAIQSKPSRKRQQYFEDLGASLERWYVGLADHLRHDGTSGGLVPPPHILLMHIQYWWAVILLHRKL